MTIIETLFDVIMIAVAFVFCIWTGIYAFKSRRENHYNTDMREHYNEHYFKQLVKQSGVKNSPEYFQLKACKLEEHIQELKEWNLKTNTKLPSTGHWESW